MSRTTPLLALLLASLLLAGCGGSAPVDDLRSFAAELADPVNQPKADAGRVPEAEPDAFTTLP